MLKDRGPYSHRYDDAVKGNSNAENVDREGDLGVIGGVQEGGANSSSDDSEEEEGDDERMKGRVGDMPKNAIWPCCRL